MEVKELTHLFSEIDKKLPHSNNLKTKALNEIKKKGTNVSLIKEIISLYLEYNNSIISLKEISDSKIWISKALKCFEVYSSKIKSIKYKIFSHQSDFLSSLLPEFLYLLYDKFIISKYNEFIIETQKDLIIDLSFFPYSASAVNFKSKRVDVAILKPCKFAINNQHLNEFNIALVAVEVKTNLDKNMISGVEYSVQRLKRTFPLCKYYLISEFADFAFDRQNYAATAIDEILITRKQKRSDVRKAGPDKINLVDVDLILNHLNEVLYFLEKQINEPPILSRRLKKGKLISS